MPRSTQRITNRALVGYDGAGRYIFDQRPHRGRYYRSAVMPRFTRRRRYGRRYGRRKTRRYLRTFGRRRFGRGRRFKRSKRSGFSRRGPNSTVRTLGRWRLRGRGNVLRKLAIRAQLSTIRPIKYVDRSDHKWTQSTTTFNTPAWYSFGLGLTQAHLDAVVKDYQNSSTTTSLSMGRVNLLGVQVKHCIRNDRNYPLYFEYWTCRPRRSIPSYEGSGDAEESPLSDQTQPSGQDVTPAMLSNGFGSYQVANAQNTTKISITDLEATPYMNKTWTAYFKLSKPRTIILQPGECFNMQYSVRRCMMNPQDWYVGTSIAAHRYVYLRARCCGPIILFKVRGVEGEFTDAGTSDQAVGSGPTAFLHMRRYKFAVVWDAQNVDKMSRLYTPVQTGSDWKTMMTTDPGFETVA